jgi:hypothetical protein
VVVDREGRVRSSHEGATDEQAMVREIRAVLAE